MAYMSQEKKAKIKIELDKVLKPIGIKYSLSVNNHATIVCNIKSGPIDFMTNMNETIQNRCYAKHILTREYIDVNPYHYKNHFSGQALEVITNVLSALNLNNYDNSDSQTDYFDVGHYVDLNIGVWDKPYVKVA